MPTHIESAEQVGVESAERVGVHEAARLTGLTPDTIYRLARQGRLRSFRVLNRSVRFDRADLLALLREQPARRPGEPIGRQHDRRAERAPARDRNDRPRPSREAS